MVEEQRQNRAGGLISLLLMSSLWCSSLTFHSHPPHIARRLAKRRPKNSLGGAPSRSVCVPEAPTEIATTCRLSTLGCSRLFEQEPNREGPPMDCCLFPFSESPSQSWILVVFSEFSESPSQSCLQGCQPPVGKAKIRENIGNLGCNWSPAEVEREGGSSLHEFLLAMLIDRY